MTAWTARRARIARRYARELAAWRLSVQMGAGIVRGTRMAFLPRRYRLNTPWVFAHLWEHEARRKVREFRDEIDAAGERLLDQIRGDQHGDDQERHRHRSG